MIITLSITIFPSIGKKENYKEKDISLNEKIIEIGYVKEQYPDVFPSWETTSFEATELDDRWRINNVVERERIDEQNRAVLVNGMALCHW